MKRRMPVQRPIGNGQHTPLAEADNCRSRDEREASEDEEMALDDDEAPQVEYAPVITEYSLPNLPNPAPTDGKVAQHS